VSSLVHQITTKTKRHEHKMLEFCQGQKISLLERKTHTKILLKEIPIDEYQYRDPWTTMPLQDQDINPLLHCCWDHHHYCFIIVSPRSLQPSHGIHLYNTIIIITSLLHLASLTPRSLLPRPWLWLGSWLYLEDMLRLYDDWDPLLHEYSKTVRQWSLWLCL